MKKLLYFISLSTLIFFTSCDQDEPEGKWSDNIKLSAYSAELSANADSVAFTTGGSWWWITHVSVNDSTYHPEEDLSEMHNYSISNDDVLVERRNTTTLFVKVGANVSGKTRTIKVGLEAGDYFDSVTVTQTAK